MGLFNFNRAKNKSETSVEQRTSWDKLGETQLVDTEDAEQDRAIIAEKARQERKAIGMVLNGKEAIVDSGDGIGEDERIQAYEKINSSEFDAEAQSYILRHIATPDRLQGSSAEMVFTEMDNRHNRRIFAYVNGIPDTQPNMDLISSEQVTETLKKYPTPIEFAPKAEEMLERVRERNTPEKYQEYVRDMQKFKHQLYGKRQEYYEAFQALEGKAEKYAEEQARRDEVLGAIRGATGDAEPTLDLTETSTIELPETGRRPERVPVVPVEVYRVEKREAKKLLKEAQIDGDAYVQDGQKFNLTTKYLEEAGFGPEYKFRIGDEAEIATSKMYKSGSHDAVTAYVKTAKGVKVVSYYRSNSQGGWRYMPDYVASDVPRRSKVDWIGKGYDEESLNLPAVTQEALEIIATQPMLDNSQAHREFAFAGTAKRYSSKDEYRAAHDAGTLRGDYYTEVDQRPEFYLGKLSRQKQAPESLDLMGMGVPDFSQRGGVTYTVKSGLYGQFQSEHFKSKDGKLLWTFNKDAQGRAWVGGVEVDSPLSSVGVRTKWAEIGDYGTPLYEYDVQTGGYGDTQDRQGSYYIGMWKNYLSKMPLIRKYLEQSKS